ncbi:hypothetical protein SAMN04488104_1005134 [Algoriphagus faecimaris]|uniref:Uncharacterized protein n=1 Tax=Algoriphagus faecimaris TaxID=686796 RepID=A0A1G6PAM4_9BACT|nr:hypothetical protein SAMN04488104_1005134 [Algoriphagus faecimaris]
MPEGQKKVLFWEQDFLFIGYEIKGLGTSP